MKKQVLWVSAGLAVFASLGAVEGCGKAQAQEARTKEQPREIQLTIYKDDFALVHEARPVELGDGRTKLRLDGVSKSLDPATVIFDWPTAQKTTDVVSQSYDLGVPSGGSLLKRLEGKPVEMLWNTQNGKPQDRIQGTLEATQDGGFVIRSGDKLYVNPNGTIVASGDQNLVTMPLLSAEVDSPAKQSAKLGFAYQTRGMAWAADYVGRMSADGNGLELECWATLENHTGIDYPNAKITLVAGSPNRAVVSHDRSSYEYESNGRARKDYGGLPATVSGGVTLADGQATGELYSYKVPAMASVGTEQMNRVKMLSSTHVPIQKDYSIRLADSGGYYESQNPQRQNAQLAISLVNAEKAGLGMPLPAGAVRIYDETSSDSTAFVGAAAIGDTPKNQHVNLTLSKVFDVYSDSRMVSSKRIDKRTIRKTFECVLHNEKKAPVDIRLVQEFYGKKHLVSETGTGKQIDSSTRQWIIHVDAGGQKTLTWTADFAS